MTLSAPFYAVNGRIADDRVREEMRRILADIRSGAFADDWLAEASGGRHRFEEQRAMMPWIAAGRSRPEDVHGG